MLKNLVISDAMPAIALTGATGFIGQHLLPDLAKRAGTTIRALTRQRPAWADCAPNSSLHWIVGDLADAPDKIDILTPGCTLINLAYPDSWTRSAHIESTTRLAQAVGQSAVRRVIHCSTAAVAGDTRQWCVTEATESSPRTDYEKTKLAIEQIWRASAAGRFDLVIVRPSAVFGPGGKNLASLASALMCENKFINYVRSGLFSRRKMNLVRVKNVVAAINLLIDRREPCNGDTFHISEDDDPSNNFRDVERILMRELGLRYYAFPPLSTPRFVLSAILRLAGRSNTNPFRIYDSKKLQQIGWCINGNIEQGLCEYAAWYLTQQHKL